MRGILQKEKILFGIVIGVLVIGFFQLAFLIYRNNVTSEEDIRYIKIQVKSIENAKISIAQNGENIECSSEGVYNVIEGDSVEVLCSVDEGYGIYSCKIDDELVDVEEVHSFHYEYQAVEDSTVDFEIKKIYSVALDIEGDGNTFLNDKGVNNDVFIFEGENMALDFKAEENCFIDEILVNDELYYKYDEGNEYITSKTYCNTTINKDYSVKVIFKIKKYHIFFKSVENLSIYINNIRQDECWVDANTKASVYFKVDNSQNIIQNVYLNNEIISKLNYCIEYTYDIENVNSDLNFDIELLDFTIINNSFDELFDLFYDVSMYKDLKVSIVKKVDKNGDVKVIVNKAIEIYYVSLKGFFLEIGNNNIKNASSGIKIVGNTKLDNIYMYSQDNNIFLYPHAISFIFDTISPTISNYRITQSSDSGNIQVITTVADQGESGVEFVCFGTKEDYDKRLTSDALKKKYNYEVTENSKSYTITLNNEELTDTYYIWATDCATNISEAMKVDVTGPEISVSTKSEWTNSDIRVQGMIEDKESNVEKVFYSKYESVAKTHTIDSEKTEEYKEATLDKSPGEFEFLLSSKESETTTYYIWGYDELGNKSEKIVTYKAMIDTACPEVTLNSIVPEDKWSNGNVKIQFSVTDQKDKNYSEVKNVFYATKDDFSDMVELQTSEDGEGAYCIQGKEDGNGNPIEMEGFYYICATDYAGNIAQTLKVPVNIDITAPNAVSVEIYTVVNGIETNISGLPYGIFSNKDLIVKVKATDSNTLSDGTILYGSGLKRVSLKLDKDEIMFEDVKTKEEVEEFVFHISGTIAGNISIVTYDEALNCSAAVSINKINPSISDSICLEDANPTISLNCEKEGYIDSQNKKWFSTDKEFSIVCEDKESGIQSISVAINGEKLATDITGNSIEVDSSDKQVKSVEYTVNTADVGESVDGHYTIEVIALDNAGNKEKSTKTIYIDRNNPVIKQFVFEANGEKDQKEELIEKMEYGYFFQEATKVTITASDGVPSSGLEAVQYYMVDYSKNTDGVKSKEKTVKVNANSEISFTISKSFKGQIFARAIDSVENVDDYYSRPYGVVVDNSVSNEQQSRVAMELPETEYKDSSGTPLYGNDVTVGVDLENVFTGIKSVHWEIVADHDTGKNQSGSITISKTGKMQGDVSDFSIEGQDHNLVTKIGGKVTVSNNSNDINIRFAITDRSGQVYEKEVKISIDKTVPSVELEFDNTNNTGYYSGNRTATIRVKERNFNADLVHINITNNEGEIPKIGQWSKQESKDNPDDNTYLTTVVFKADGLYSINVTLSDLSGKDAKLAKGETFTVDQSAPVISTEMGIPNNKIKNVGYYQEGVKIKLHITERNFDENKVRVTGNGVFEGKDVKLPVVKFISSNGKDQYLQMNFIQEGEYTISISCTDEAGNESEQMQEIKFIIDKTAPEVIVKGVEECKAYNGKVVPVITCSDKNYKDGGTKISFYKGDGTKIILEPVKKTEEKQATYTFDCFPEEESYDQVYKIVIQSSDLSGNYKKKEVNFSINRFGSTYYLSEILKQKNGSYVSSEFDVVLTEVNINKLDPDAIVVRLIYNDSIKDLEKDKDYTVVCNGDEDFWYTYEYHISKEMMKEEGKYSIALYSKDGAGNINENSDTGKMAEVWFGIDKTAPRIVSLNLEEGTVYNEEEKQVNINIDDNLVLGETKIYVDNKEATFIKGDTKYTFDVKSSKEAQNIKIVAKDLAGNETVEEIDNIYVTTDFIVRFCNDKTLIMVTIIGGMAAILAAGSVIYFIKRKKAKMKK